MHSCVGRIRYLGVLLYDADKIHETASTAEDKLVDQHLDMLLDPNDPEVIKAAKENGVADSTIKAAQSSPIYQFVKEWGMALPLHPEYRTLPSLFYVPPLLPVMASLGKKKNEDQQLNEMAKRWDDEWLYDTSTDDLFGTIEESRFPLEYLASLFSAGNTQQVEIRVKKLMAVRIYRRWKTVGDISEERANETLADVGLDQAMAEKIYYLTSLAKFDDRFVIPPAHREEAIEMIENTGDRKGNTGFGFKEGTAQRGL
jgi:nitrate reductase beta subunit